MELQRYFIFGIVFATISDCLRKTSISSSFGQFELEINNVEKCPNILGPFDPDTYNHYEVFWKKENGTTVVEGYMNILKSHRVIKVTFIANLWSGTEFKQVFQKAIKKPCQRELIRILVSEVVQVDSSCNFPKGNFTYKCNKIEPYTRRVFGKRFYYGKMRLDGLFYSNKGLTFCVNATVELKPKAKPLKISNKTHT